MGTGDSKPEETDKLTNLLRDAAHIVQATTCSDLLRYRMQLRPILDKLLKGGVEIQPLTVDRERLFEGAISFYKKADPKKHVQLMVTFRTGGCVEEGLDGSGLRREFYSAFFKECLLGSRNMFLGDGRRKVPSNDMSLIQAGYFSALGRAVVASILNGDCGFPYLAPCVFYYLTGEDYSTHLLLEDVPDLDIKLLCRQLLKAKNDQDLLVVLETAAVIDHIGWPPGQSIDMRTRDALVQQLIRWSLVDKRKLALDQLREGLEHMGFLGATKSQPTLLPLLVYSAQYSISASYIQNKLLPKISELVPKDDTQKQAQIFATACIQSLTDEEARWLFQYVTGALDPPVLEEPISVDFNTFKASQKYPEASTCSCKLWIPLGNRNKKEFRESFRTALESFREGFGQG